ncbi:MAG TPA: Nif3-like dinuclear metal center hexameric protein [Tepidisphaeraceae bacterium]|jgi:dinuclear metal center YbgI/SA1388 family protein
MNVSDIVTVLEEIASASLAESWDNVGLLAGDSAQAVQRCLLTIDYTPAVAAEAREKKCEMVISYHPPIFEGLKKITGSSLIFQAIRDGVAIYSPHTALDVAEGGTNDLLAEILGLQNVRSLRLVETKAHEFKLVTFVPAENLEEMARALFDAGAGWIGKYSQCSFRSQGEGTFFAGEGSDPAVGKKGKLTRTPEVRFETILPRQQLPAVLAALYKAHPYEEPALDLIQLATPPAKVGQGRIGTLANISRAELFERVKKGLSLSHILIAGPKDGNVKKGACLAGAGRRHLGDAIAQKAEVYLTGELPHHDALAAAKAGVTVIATLHSNSERAILPRLAQRMQEKLRDVQFLISQRDHDPFGFV